ncbi:MAG: RNA polymerase sigma-70 factor [Arachidicoccus sp.]|nr:RNA polymerase sigma-70 factor [Arachidicoccus sp.]
MDVKDLMQQIADGNELAFKQLFEKFRDKLHVFVKKIVKNKEVAEEIVLDIFTKIWTNRDLAIEITNIERFLFKASVNRSIDYIRAVSKDKILKQVIWDEIQIADVVNSDDILITKNLQENVSAAIHGLPPQRQLIFKLNRENGMSYEQIAAELHISKNTVRNHMVEALRFIRTQLHAHQEIILLIIFFKNI